MGGPMAIQTASVGTVEGLLWASWGLRKIDMAPWRGHRRRHQAACSSCHFSRPSRQEGEGRDHRVCSSSAISGVESSSWYMNRRPSRPKRMNASFRRARGACSPVFSSSPQPGPYHINTGANERLRGMVTPILETSIPLKHLCGKKDAI